MGPHSTTFLTLTFINVIKYYKSMVQFGVCSFQIQEEKEDGEVLCSLTGNDDYTLTECNPDTCPTYQTWQLLLKASRSLR